MHHYRTTLVSVLVAVSAFVACDADDDVTVAHVEATTTTVAPPPTSTTSTSTSTSTTAAPATTTTTRRVTATTTTTAAETAACHPSYSGACLPPDTSDVDCAGGSGNGPVYTSAKRFRVVGPDEYDLDRDGNGYACES